MGWTRFRLPTVFDSGLGAVRLAGEVSDDVPHVPVARRMDSWILSVVTAGRGLYREPPTGDRRGVEETITSGSVLLVPPGRTHWYGTRGNAVWSELFVVFDGALFDTLAAAGTLRARRPAPLDPVPSMAGLRAVVSAEPVDAAAADLRLLALAGWLAELRAAERDGAAPEGRDAGLARAARRLAADTRAELDLHDLATETGMSYDRFRRRFAAVHGRAPAAYRNEARLAAAAQLLRLTGLGQREIARRLGYSDEFHLSRRFRARYGVPPGRYRRGA
ncbi:AraC-like DNA-binding protein [Friedmanniella endophytica]|uniref:AraC-like DNA-binding protein n=1 Tax=Microlunatus kandeliicorticis TaxID=1759536 RepID=A0A7W3P712_9ACTN|nr:AraC family transcriptional regulator [Microlunatus kandeliicorticis]MBA8795507.1 AraC-like DNA-binding protein [Microlunatus kandeliicorticis]